MRPRTTTRSMLWFVACLVFACLCSSSILVHVREQFAFADALSVSEDPKRVSDTLEPSRGDVQARGGSSLGREKGSEVAVHVGYAASATTPEVVAYKWWIWKESAGHRTLQKHWQNSEEQDEARSDGPEMRRTRANSHIEHPPTLTTSVKSSGKAHRSITMELVTIWATLSATSRTYPSTEVCLEARQEGNSLAMLPILSVAPCKATLVEAQRGGSLGHPLGQKWFWGSDTTIRSALNTSLCVCSDPFRNRNDTRTFFEAFLAPCDPRNVWQRHAHESEAPGTNPASHHLWTGSLYFLVQEF